MSIEIKPQQRVLNNKEVEAIIKELRKDFYDINLKIDMLTKEFGKLIVEFNSVLKLMEEKSKL